jgi:hypothetical protein
MPTIYILTLHVKETLSIIKENKYWANFLPLDVGFKLSDGSKMSMIWVFT